MQSLFRRILVYLCSMHTHMLISEGYYLTDLAWRGLNSSRFWNSTKTAKCEMGPCIRLDIKSGNFDLVRQNLTTCEIGKVPKKAEIAKKSYISCACHIQRFFWKVPIWSHLVLLIKMFALIWMTWIDFNLLSCNSILLT